MSSTFCKPSCKLCPLMGEAFMQYELADGVPVPVNRRAHITITRAQYAELERLNDRIIDCAYMRLMRSYALVFYVYARNTYGQPMETGLLGELFVPYWKDYGL